MGAELYDALNGGAICIAELPKEKNRKRWTVNLLKYVLEANERSVG
jgi:hypothetical protein